MADGRTLAWILLSVPDSPGTLRDIIWMADAINHAIPSHQELQTSLGWLRARGLVRKDGKRFCITESGSQFLARLRGGPRQTLMRMWGLVTAELESLQAEPAAPPDDLTFEEFNSAYKDYHKAFWKAYRELEKKDRGIRPGATKTKER